MHFIASMNTVMWRHPVTSKQIRVLEEEWGVGKTGDGNGWFEVLRPQQKTLVCGDVGDGAMMEWTEIVSVIQDRLSLLVG
jgi:phosphopantothenoylcysteine decarboxylase